MKYAGAVFYYVMRYLIGLLALTILISAAAAAFLNGIIGYPSGESFYDFLAPICHQSPTECFWLFGHPLALCARCTGGYTGVLLGSMLFSVIVTNESRLMLYSVSITIFLFAVVEAIIHISSDNLWRFVSGFSGGIGATFAFLCVIHALSDMSPSHRLSRLKTN